VQATQPLLRRWHNWLDLEDQPARTDLVLGKTLTAGLCLVWALSACGGIAPEPSPSSTARATSTPSGSLPTPGVAAATQHPSPSAVGTPQSASPSSQAKDVPPGPRIVEVPVDAIRSVTLPEAFLTENEVNDFDAYGEDAVYVELNGPTAGRGQQVWHVDLASGQVSALNGAARGVVTLFPRISGSDVVWVTAADGPNESVKWKVMHYDLASRVMDVVAQGTNTRLDAGSADTPIVDVDSGMVAYTQEETRRGHPFAEQIVVKRLSDGMTVRTFDSDSSVWDLALSNGDVLFSQGASDQVSTQITDTAVDLSTATSPQPKLIGPTGFQVGLDNQRMVWNGLDQSMAAPGLWTETYSEAAATDVSSGEQSALDRFPAVGDGLVSWDAQYEDWSYLSVWDVTTRQAARMFGFGDVEHTGNTDDFLSSAGGGWLTWTYVEGSRDSFGTQTFSTISLADLRAALE